MAAWVVCALCALVMIKPQEFVPALAALPLLHLAFAAALAGTVLDVVWKRLRPRLAPQVPYVFAFLLWALATTAVKHPAALGDRALSAVVLVVIFLAVAIGVGSAAGLRAFAMAFVAVATLVTWVALAQSQAPLGCFIGEPEDWEGRGELTPDGRPCETTPDCTKNAPVPNGNYRCERGGPLGTSSIGGRVRYRGSLADPNELSLTISLAVPLALGLVEARRRDRRRTPGAPPSSASASASASAFTSTSTSTSTPTSTSTSDVNVNADADADDRRGWDQPSRPHGPALLPPLVSDRLLRRVAQSIRALPAHAVILAIGFTVILSQSRSGLIVFLAVVGLHAIRKVGLWGVVAACVVVPPMLVLGGRSGAEADSSTDERAELLREALELIRTTRGLGLGMGQFSDESSIGLTAHNSYVLAAAEAGIVGLVLFGLVVYLSLKVPFAIWFGGYDLDARVAAMAPAIAVAMCGAVLGIFFLSWTYKDILYMIFGASAALYSAAKACDPRVEVKLSLKEAALVALSMIGMLGVVYVAMRVRK